MFDRSEMAERHARILKRLSEIGEAVAEKLADQALAAETPEQTAQAAAAFDRAARGLRLTLSLEARLARQSRQADHEEAGYARHLEGVRRAARAVAAGRAVTKRIVAEYEAERDEHGAHERLMRRLKALTELIEDCALSMDEDGDLASDTLALRQCLDVVLPDDVVFEHDCELEPG